MLTLLVLNIYNAASSVLARLTSDISPGRLRMSSPPMLSPSNAQSSILF